MKREWELIDWDIVRNKLDLDPRLIVAATTSDVDEISSIIIKVINEALDSQAPIKRVQQKNKPTATFASAATKTLISDRDKARDKASATEDIEDIRNYRTLRNRCHKELSRDKINHDKEIYNKVCR